MNIAAILNKGDTVHIDIEASLLLLTENVTFKHLYALTVIGRFHSLSTISCKQPRNNYPGIKLHNITNLTLKNLKLIYCGSQIKIRSKRYSSALILLYCNNVTMKNLLIAKSKGIGLTIINHQEGTVNVSGSNFTKNKIPRKFEGRTYGGGGIFIEYHRNYSLTGETGLNFDHCVFDKNIAYTRLYQSLYRNEFGEERTRHGRGGGVFLDFESSIAQQSSLILSFSHCTFTKNKAFLGGGFSMKIGRGRIHQIDTKIIAIVRNSVFDSNGCNSTRLGGGIHLAYNLNFKSVSIYCKLQNVNFTNNSAELGGGLFFFS